MGFIRLIYDTVWPNLCLHVVFELFAIIMNWIFTFLSCLKSNGFFYCLFYFVLLFVHDIHIKSDCIVYVAFTFFYIKLFHQFCIGCYFTAIILYITKTLVCEIIS